MRYGIKGGIRAWLGIFLTLASQEVASAQSFSFESRGMKLQRDRVESNVGPIWAMVFLPDGQLLMTIKTGSMKLYKPEKRSFTEVQGVPKVAVFGQGGLLDVALSPDFKKDRTLYISYSKEVAKESYTTALGTAQLDGARLSNFKEIFVAQGSSTRGEHFAGRLVIEPTAIWFSVGERGERDNAQIMKNHLGKILRLTRTGAPHPENPFLGQKDVLPEIYSYGHRNPQGLAKHPLSGEIWEHEHGPRGGDEINIIQKGKNYGWPKATYGAEYWGPVIGDKVVRGTEQPIHYWIPSIAPCGLVIYNGDALPGWKGLVLAGSLAKTHLNLTEIKNNRMVAEERLFTKESLRVREIEEGPDGTVWYATDDGSLFHIKKI